MASRRRLRQWLDAQEPVEDEPRPPGVSPALERHFAALVDADAGAASVLVPLCGQSVDDLVWLAEQGLQAVGVEASRRAIARSAAERGLELHAGDAGEDGTGAGGAALLPWYLGPCTVFEGDFFDATPGTLGGAFELAYDHDALSTVAVARRAEYAEVLCGLLGPYARVLAVVPEFDEGLLDETLAALGPHSVGLQELRELFDGFSCEVLAEERLEPSGRYARLRAAGVSSVVERAVLLTRAGLPPEQLLC